MNIIILFSTETGNSKEIAKRIQREAKRRYLKTFISSLDEIPPQIHNLIFNNTLQNIFIFCCSTTGDGQHPASMNKFWKYLLRKSHSNLLLSDLKYAVFGCGDSSYPKFNYPAKKLHKRLSQLGATPLIYRGDGALDPWLAALWDTLLKLNPLPPGKNIIPENVLLPPDYYIRFANEQSSDKTFDYNTQFLSCECNNVSDNCKCKFIGTVTENKRLTNINHFQDVRHLELSHDTEYQTGDVLVVYPINSKVHVDEFINLLGWQEIKDKIVQIHHNNQEISIQNINIQQSHSSLKLPEKIRLYDLIMFYLDIRGQPRRYFFQLLSFFTPDEQHSEKLLELSSADGQDDLYKYSHLLKRTTLEVLQDFPSRIPISYLLDLIPLLRPRYFSISSSSLMYPKSIHLTVAIVGYYTKMKAKRMGVCTEWISGLNINQNIVFQLRKGTMKLPVSTETPVILIGPGTGIAPMRAFIQHRIQMNGFYNILFYGCRNQQLDFLYEEELKAYEGKGQLELYCAFSRDQEEKVYVQDVMKKNGMLIWRILENGGHLYVSGNAQLPQGINLVLKEICVEHGLLSQEESEEYIKQLGGRIALETWS